MSLVTLSRIHAFHPALDRAVDLFDRYRMFYGQPSDPALARGFLTQRLRAGESTVFLARTGEDWVGFCQLYTGFSSIACGRTIVLNDLYVEPSRRGAGVGRALIERAIAWARQRGAMRVVLETADTNDRAQALYERLGFARSQGFIGYALDLGGAPAAGRAA